MRKYLRTVFHGLIIAFALLALAGCGFKADPFYSEEKQEVKSQ